MKKMKRKLNHAIYAGTDALMDHDPRKRICLGVNIMSLSVIAIDSTIGGITYFLTRNTFILAGVIVAIILIIGPLLLNSLKKYRSASLAFFSIITLSVFYFCCLLGKSAESQLMILYLIGLSLFMFNDWGTQIVCIIISILVIILVEINFTYGFIKPMEASEGTRAFVRWSVYFIAIVLVALTFLLYKSNNLILLQKTQEYTKIIETNLENEEKENQKKDNLISNATHEMRVSFYAIFSIIDMLYKRAKNPKNDNFKDTIDDLRAACTLSKSVIDNIFEYEKYAARLNNTILTQFVDLRLLVLNLVDIYKYLAIERGVTIARFVSDEVPQHILCDEVKIRQIISNLLHNAIKFTRYNTTISVRVETKNDNLLLSVQDQGEGILPEKAENIFEPFVTQNPDGLGLGLFVVKEFVSSLRGEISVSSDANTGALFIISLPLHSVG